MYVCVSFFSCTHSSETWGDSCEYVIKQVGSLKPYVSSQLNKSPIEHAHIPLRLKKENVKLKILHKLEITHSFSFHLKQRWSFRPSSLNQDLYLYCFLFPTNTKSFQSSSITVNFFKSNISRPTSFCLFIAPLKSVNLNEWAQFLKCVQWDHFSQLLTRAILWSISSTFYELHLAQYSVNKKVTKPNCN